MCVLHKNPSSTTHVEVWMQLPRLNQQQKNCPRGYHNGGHARTAKPADVRRSVEAADLHLNTSDIMLMLVSAVQQHVDAMTKIWSSHNAKPEALHDKNHSPVVIHPSQLITGLEKGRLRVIRSGEALVRHYAYMLPSHTHDLCRMFFIIASVHVLVRHLALDGPSYHYAKWEFSHSIRTVIFEMQAPRSMRFRGARCWSIRGEVVFGLLACWHGCVRAVRTMLAIDAMITKVGLNSRVNEFNDSQS